jgi:hypothetical protein
MSTIAIERFTRIEFGLAMGQCYRDFSLHNEGSASDVRLDRLPRLPVVCEHSTPNTPAGNFEVFTRTWAENYILFDQKKVDWAEVVRANQSEVWPETTPAELFDILAEMIAPLHKPSMAQ